MTMQSDSLQLDKQLCFPLYAASREVIKLYRPFLDALGLTYTQYVVMAVIWAEGLVSVRDLGRRLYLDSGTLTPVLKTLEKLGYVTRRRSKEDERVLLVNVTASGRALQEQALGVGCGAEDKLGLTPEECTTLHALLYKVLAAIGEE